MKVLRMMQVIHIDNPTSLQPVFKHENNKTPSSPELEQDPNDEFQSFIGDQEDDDDNSDFQQDLYIPGETIALRPRHES